MGKPLDLIGKKFGRLTVVKQGRPGTNTYGRPIRKWVCECECGNETTVTTGKLTTGLTVSCGCYWKEVNKKAVTTHGLRYRPEYQMWSSMKRRCHNEKDSGYKKYGAKGIKVCDRWRESFAYFIEDMGPRPPGTSIDRIDGTKGYYKENCRWATPLQQANNLCTTRFFTVNGETETITGFAKKWGCSRDAIKLRLRRGQSIEHIAEVMKLKHGFG
jgi:hypothetical protein